MKIFDQLQKRWQSDLWFRLGQRPLRSSTFEGHGPDWSQCKPGWISRALELSQQKDSGGWYVVDGVRAIGEKPRAYQIAGQELVVWRNGKTIHAAPDRCPHMGARLSDGHVSEGQVVCPWHGMKLGTGVRRGPWQCLETHHDGVLFWVNLADHKASPPRPIVAKRPITHLDSVIRREANCEPEDIIANRLDPWHGVHFHPHSFATLQVLGLKEDSVAVRVTYRIVGPIGMEVDAEFTCPDSRTIVMTIVDGEGTGSVVETHATPIAPHRTAVIEATLATSTRAGFALAIAAGALIRPFMARAFARLWDEDIAYAERRYELRTKASHKERRTLQVMG